MKIRLLLSFLLLGCLFCLPGCSDDEDPKNLPIVTALPKMYLNLMDPCVIWGQRDLDRIVPEDIQAQYPELSDIDFSKYSLLIGHYHTPNLYDRFEHIFTTKRNGQYEYHMIVNNNGPAPTQPDSFNYGIIVDKIPEHAKVAFSAELLIKR